MQFGLKVHEILELLDLKNPNLDLIEDNFIKEKINRFLNNDILKNIKDSNIYKEYIEALTNKETNIYLYSIIGENLQKL